MQLSPKEVRLKRLKMRSWRRGMKEMDLILGPFADGPLRNLSDAQLDDYEQLLDENDQDLYLWVTGAQEAPKPHVSILAIISATIGALPR